MPKLVKTPSPDDLNMPGLEYISQGGMADLEKYDASFVPAPFGLANPGVICYLNSLLQALASCPSIAKTVLAYPAYMEKTKTGKAFYDFVAAFANTTGVASGIEAHSARVLAALVADLRARRKKTAFGYSQESASEGLVELLDMIEPPSERHHPLSALFRHRYTIDLHCGRCKAVSTREDVSIQFNIFDLLGSAAAILEKKTTPPATPAEFASLLTRPVSVTEDYQCKCVDKDPDRKRARAVRVHKLMFAPEILVCAFNAYAAPGQRYNIGDTRRAKYIPAHLDLRGATPGQSLRYVRVAEVEHSGTNYGGHYTSRGLRRAGEGAPTCHYFNDRSHAPSKFAETGNQEIYLVFYHFEKIVDTPVPPAAPAAGGSGVVAGILAQVTPDA